MSRSDFMATTACYMLRVAGLKQLNWASEGVGATAAALVDLSTVAGNKISNPPWVKFQSAGWVNFPSAPTITLMPLCFCYRQRSPHNKEQHR
ncbi:hypothetical protein [Stutzerimonas nitrititolerans]|uniref:hypothetical protein n=1 Tax=Stutzerimonas nitrititolerans TaxID=2482751 RepID=UPI0028B0187E|nr:hypothetical protein [Stutzerimonas nitrititolerans]